MRRGAIAEISLDAVSSNLKAVRSLADNRPVIAVVKADAYGHGAVEVSKRLVSEGVFALAVAFVSEAVELREAGIEGRILVLFDNRDTSRLFEYHLTPVIYDLKTARRVSDEAARRGSRIPVHLKIDTGMGRLGFSGEDLVKELSSVCSLGYLTVSGLMSHFSEADMADISFARLQLDRFHKVRMSLMDACKGSFLCHLANSAATMTFNDSHLDAVRPGIMLYGCSPLREERESPCVVHPAMRVTTRVLTLRRVAKGVPVSYGRTFVTGRDSLIGVLPVGYADGYNRTFSNNANVLVKGKRAPVVGRVCMDLTMVDLTGVEAVQEGDEVVLLGKQGDQEIRAGELAERAGTIPYEILTTLGRSSRKIYV